MPRSTKESWLDGPADLKEADVDDVPVKGQSVRVRGLAAAFSNQASSEALEMITGPRGQQSAKVNQARLEVIQFHQGCIDPSFTEQEALLISQKYGPAFKAVIAKIDELSGVDKEAIEEATARFHPGGEVEVGANGEPVPTGGGRPPVPARTGA